MKKYFPWAKKTYIAKMIFTEYNLHVWICIIYNSHVFWFSLKILNLNEKKAI